MSNNSINDSILFNIGKSFGLENDRGPLEEYKKAVKDLNDHFEKNVNNGFKKFRTRRLELKSALKDLSKQSGNDVAKLRNKSSELITYLISLIKSDLKNNQWLEEQVQGMFKKALERYEQSLTDMFATDAALKVAIAAFEEYLNRHIETSEEELRNYLAAVKHKQEDFLEMEEGFRFGLALRTALDIEHK